MTLTAFAASHLLPIRTASSFAARRTPSTPSTPSRRPRRRTPFIPIIAPTLPHCRLCTPRLSVPHSTSAPSTSAQPTSSHSNPPISSRPASHTPSPSDQHPSTSTAPITNPSVTPTPTTPDLSPFLLPLLAVAAFLFLDPSAVSASAAHSSVLSALPPVLRTFITGPHFAVVFGLGIGSLVQSLTGFGFAIITVSTLTQQDWIANSTVLNAVQPVAATLGALVGWVQLVPEFRQVEWRTVTLLAATTALTTPLGALVFPLIDAHLVIHALGALIAIYVVYSAAGVSVPRAAGGRVGAAGLGLLAGALGGALDMASPPLVIHADAARWEVKSGQFRRNMLAVVSANSSCVVLWDFFTGRLNDFYYSDFIGCGLPPVLVGIVLGRLLVQRIDAKAFKKVVLAVCFMMGGRLLLS